MRKCLYTNEYRGTEVRLHQQVAPLFVEHPSPATNEVIHGSSLTLNGFAIGNPVPSFQWKRDGVAISGATSTNYTIASMASTDQGSYTLVASNASGVATSTASYVKYFSSGATPIESSIWTNATFRLTINNVVGYNYIVFGSTNFTTWVPLSTNTVPFTFTDFAATNFPYRFYRSQFIP